MALFKGTGTLGAGGTVVVAARISATSIIQATIRDPIGVPGILTVPVATRNVGAQTFVVTSTNAGDLSTFDWLVTG